MTPISQNLPEPPETGAHDSRVIASDASSEEADQHPLDSIGEEFAARCRHGEAVTIDQYVQRYPQWASELRELLSSIALMEKLKAHGSGAHHGTGASLPPPQRLGDFRIIREIGRGGMGVVYEALEQSLGRHVAVKILSASAMIDPRRLQRFEREAQAAGRLHHTNIVPVFGVGKVDAIHFYVMQFIEGDALNQILGRMAEQAIHPARNKSADESKNALAPDAAPREESPPLGNRYWRWVAEVGQQVAGALDYAHQQGTLHRDVKPANLLLDARGTVWITDFGLAKLEGPRDVTQSGDVVGTLQYLAPEALHGKADPRSDIYSLGLTLYELLTLKAPIQGDTPAATLRAVAETTPIAPRRIVAEIPSDLETIVLKAIARDPRSRYQTAGALAVDLENFLNDRPISARRILLPERLWRWCRRNRAVALASALAVSAALIALVVGWVGYVNTRDALAAEARRRVEADRATARAEQNMQLSLHAFEDIFNQVDQQQSVVLNPPPPDDMRGRPPARLGPPRENGEGEAGALAGRPSAPAVNRASDANILRSILSFYDKFAHENPTNPILDAEAARAYQRIGDLYFRMGSQEPAAQLAYERAATMYEHLRQSEDQSDVASLTGFADALTSMTPVMAIAATQPIGSASAVVPSEALTRQRARLTQVIEALALIASPTHGLEQRRASALTRLGEVQLMMGDTDAAAQRFSEAMSIWRRLPPLPPPGPPIAAPQAPDTALQLARLLIGAHQPMKARALLLEVSHLNGGPRPDVPPGQREKMAELDDELAAIEKSTGNTRGAEQASHEAARLRSPRDGPGQDRRPGEPPPADVNDEGQGPPRNGFGPPPPRSDRPPGHAPRPDRQPPGPPSDDRQPPEDAPPADRAPN